MIFVLLVICKYLISAQKWYISCVNLGTLVICFANYLRKKLQFDAIMSFMLCCLISMYFSSVRSFESGYLYDPTRYTTRKESISDEVFK